MNDVIEKPNLNKVTASKPARNDKGQLLEQPSWLTGRRPGVGNKITVGVRDIVEENRKSHLRRLLVTAKAEHEARDTALKLHTESLTAFTKVIEKLVTADDTVEIKEIVETLQTQFTLTLPALESSKMFNAILMRCLPQLKSIEMKGESSITLMGMILNMSGDEALALQYLQGGKDAVPELQQAVAEEEE
jgi:hypothetical protein